MRDYVHPDDVAESFYKSYQFMLKNNKNEIFNCGSGEPITVKELCEKIIKISRKDIQIKFNKAKPSIPFDMFLDCSKAKKEIDWSPKTNIDQGITKTLNWWKKNIKK